MYRECPVTLRRFKTDAVKTIHCEELKNRIRTIFKLGKSNYENVIKTKYLVFQKMKKK